MAEPRQPVDSRPDADGWSPDTDANPAVTLPSELGERRVVTILFADIVSSTRLLDGLDPDDAMELLDDALTRMVAPVRAFGGTVARVQGDGIMAMFGAPSAYEDHAIRACLAARSHG